MDTDRLNQEEKVSGLKAYEEEWYEDTVDVDLRAYSMTEEEWVEQERQKTDSPTSSF